MASPARPALAAALAVGALAACGPIFGIGASFSLHNAHVDSSYSCPDPATNLAYGIHASIDASNTTSKSVTIKSISETWTNIAVHGNWTGTKGDHGTTGVDDYAPHSVASGSSTTIKFVIPFQCTNSGAGASTYGDFSFKFVVTTSDGVFTISPNNHRLTFQT